MFEAVNVQIKRIDMMGKDKKETKLSDKLWKNYFDAFIKIPSLFMPMRFIS